MQGPFQSANQKLLSDNGSAPNPSCPLGGAGLGPHSGLATASPDTPPRLVGESEPFPDTPAWQSSPRSGGARARHRTRGPGQPAVTLSRLWPPPGGFPRGRRAGPAGPTGVEPASISGGARLYGDRLGPDTVSDLRLRCVPCFRPQTLRAAAHPPRRDPPLRPIPVGSGWRDGGYPARKTPGLPQSPF